MSKYESLWKYVKENKKEEYKISFDDVAKITGFPFDHTFLSLKKELQDYGYFNCFKLYKQKKCCIIK